MDWKHFPIINRQEGWSKNILGGKKIEKLISGGWDVYYALNSMWFGKIKRGLNEKEIELNL